MPGPASTQPRRWPQWWAVVPVGLIAAFLVVLVGAAPGSAHTELTDATPAGGERLATPPESIILEFSDEIDPAYVALALTLGAGEPSQLDAEVENEQVKVAVSPGVYGGQSGKSVWTLAYRVVSADGHPVSGTLSFSVQRTTQPQITKETSAEPNEPHTTQPGPTAEDNGETASSGPHPWAWITVLGAAALLVGSVLVLRGRRRQ